jgi:hypothetical protein
VGLPARILSAVGGHAAGDPPFIAFSRRFGGACAKALQKGNSLLEFEQINADEIETIPDAGARPCVRYQAWSISKGEGFMGTKFWCGIGLLASVAVSAGVASAADLSVKAPPRGPAPFIASPWDGFYIGGHIGWGGNGL